MNQIEIQRRMLITVAGLVLLSVTLMIIIIPSVLHDTSDGANPKSAAIGIALAMIFRLIVLLGFLKVIRENKRGRPANKGLNIGLGILLILFGLFYMDGAFAFLDHILFVSILMFISVFCDFVAALITFAVLFIKSTK